MRRRSSTFHTENVDEFLQAAQQFDACPHPFRKTASKRRPKNLQCDKDGNPFAKDMKEENTLEEHNSSWDNFDFDCENANLNHNRICMTMPSLTFSDNTIDTDCSDVEAGLCKEIKSSVLRRIMVIGMNGSGKHSLINTIFECEDQSGDRKGQVIDLLTKAEYDEDERHQVRYQFWIQNLYGEGDERKEKLKELVKVYYKNVSLFVFVYSVTDKRSFECLNSAIEAVMKEVPAEKFRAILLGNKGDMEDKREVCLVEGISLQDKYKLAFFMETSYEDQCLRERLVQALNEGEGGAKDLGTKKGYSILSTD